MSQTTLTEDEKHLPQPYRYPCQKCGKPALITETHPASSGGEYKYHAKHLDEITEDHEWGAIDLFKGQSQPSTKKQPIPIATTIQQNQKQEGWENLD